MILLNGSELIEIASTGDINKINEILPNDSKEIPAIEVSWDGNRSYCRLSYINKEGKTRNTEIIQIGHVFLKGIFIEKRECEEKNWFNEYNHYSSYHFTIHFSLDKNVKIFVINSGEFTSTKDLERNRHFNSIFTYLIPLINDNLESGVPLPDLNIYYYEQKYKDGGKKYASYEKNPFKICLDDVLNLIYNTQVGIADSKPDWYSNDDMSCYASFNSKDCIIYNKYVAELISAIIKTEIIKEDVNFHQENVIYKTRAIKNLPTYVKYDIESFRRYLQRELYIGIVLNYKQNKADEGFMCFSRIKDCKKIEIDDNIISLFNFILGLKATCYKDGKTRVGRDDEGWMEYTVLFPTEFGFKPSKYMIELINELLHVKLEKQDNNLCYYYRYTTEPEYIPGSACREEYWSNEYQRDCLHEIIKKIVPMLLSDKERNLLFDEMTCDK